MMRAGAGGGRRQKNTQQDCWVLSFPGCTLAGGTENDVGVIPYGISKAVWPARRRDVSARVLEERDGPREDEACEMSWEKMGLEN